MVRVEVPATTANLGPAFDAVGMALQIYNVVEMEEAPSGLVIEVEGQGADAVPGDESNLVYQAAKEVFDRVGYRPLGLRIKLVNNIPVASGLGSSAAAIIGGMAAANKLAGEKLTKSELLVMANAREGHPDNVAAALLGGIVVAVAHNNRVEHISFTPPKELRAVVAIPRFSMSTKAARGLLPSGVSFRDAVFNVGRTAFLVASLAKGNLEGLMLGTEDRLHQPYRSHLIPGMAEVLDAVRQAGAKGVALSGAGPTLIAFTAGSEAQVACAMRDTWAAQGVQAEIMVVKPDRHGVRVT